jgi:signal transduction histidine kinase
MDINWSFRRKYSDEMFDLNKKPSWARSLRFQLTLWFACLLTLVLSVSAIVLCAAARHAILRETDSFLIVEGRQIVSSLSLDSSDPPDKEDIDALVAGTSVSQNHGDRHSGLLFFRTIYTRIAASNPVSTIAQSKNLSRFPRFAAEMNGWIPATGKLPLTHVFFAQDPDGRPVRALCESFTLLNRPAVLQIAVPWDGNESVLEKLTLVVSCGIVIVVVLATAGGWILVGRTLAPIRRIVTEAERIGGENVPGTLLPEPDETDSEVGHLVTTLNSMTGRIFKSVIAERQAYEAQKALADVQRQFAQDASHELRTPLTILRGEVEYALLRPRDRESYQQTLQNAMTAIDQLCQIVEDLGILARLDGEGTHQQFCDDVDLLVICRSVVNDTLAMAERKQIVLDFSHSESVSGVYLTTGNEGLLRQIVRNLVDNAIKYTPAGGHVNVSLGSQMDTDGNSKNVITVSDTGIGISEDDLPHIFERFWRSGRTRSEDGNGLGLAICESIAKEHQGSISVESKPGIGSRFKLFLKVH